MGLRMFGDISSLEGARETVCFLVERLESCFLLLEGDRKNSVKMHDVVRDVAIFIASDEKLKYDECIWHSPYIGEKFQLHVGSAVYPNLRLLLINSRRSRDQELEIGDDFFERMGELNVLSVGYSSLRLLPQTTKLMKNLKTLILVMCRSLESISVIGELVNLEILICLWCESIESLPIEMERISRLRLLEFSGCKNLKTIAPGIISKQKGLEELIVKDFDNWEAADEERERKNASLSELEHLSSLTRLKIKIKDYRVAAGHKGPSPNMVKYDITIGDGMYVLYRYSEGFEKALKLKLAGNISLGKWIHECVRSVEYMWLEGSGDSSLDFGVAHQHMRSLTLKRCWAVKKLVNMSSSSATVFPLLEMLELEDLSELEEICHIDGPMQSNSFQNLQELRLVRLPALKHLWNSGISPNQQNVISSFNRLSSIYISDCHGLQSLFSLSVMASGSWFVQLESLEIWSCHMMEQVLLCNEEENQTNIHIPLVFPKLKKLKLSFLRRLTSFCKGIKSIEFPLLDQMEVVKCTLKSFVFTTSTRSPDDDDDSIHLFHQLDKVKFDCLKVVRLGILEKGQNSNCSQIPIELFREVQKLEISECDMMEQVLWWNEEEDQINNGITLQFPKLKFLELASLPRLTSFSKGIFQSIEFCLLEEMEVRKCPLLKGLVSSWSSDDHHDVSNIHFFSKFKIDRLTKLVADENIEMGKNLHQFPIDLFTGLCELKVSAFKDLKSLFSLPMTQSGCCLSQLEKLEIRRCEIMEQIILCNEEESQRKIHIIPFPKLKHLILDSLPKLMSFCKGIESIVEFSLPEKMEIRNCPILLESCVSTFISPTGPHDIDDSMHLFCEPNKISFCEEMVKVIEDEEEEEDAPQISLFPNLKHLNLWNLKKLKSFCEWRCALQLPKLEDLSIRNCHVMDKFTLGALNTPNLKTIYIDFHNSGNEVNKVLQQHRLKREKERKMRLGGELV
ncbi:hypothetical protein C2S51_000715 [Perilla frutescens var. frutescens]|nr:hypothetical protein C2S51_000715 [Perilla frutescens var. frutescens]